MDQTEQVQNQHLSIQVVKGCGTGKNTLSAFDSALKGIGVYNYNLIVLSSIIPPNSYVARVESYNAPRNEFGHRLYVIKSDIRSEIVGQYIAAGLGWYQFDDQRGLFVEHEFAGITQVAVESEMKKRIRDSLQDLCDFRGILFDDAKMNMEIAITKVTDLPSCALVVAVYQSQGW